MLLVRAVRGAVRAVLRDFRAFTIEWDAARQRARQRR